MMIAARRERVPIAPLVTALGACAIAGAAVALRHGAAPLIGIGAALAIVSLTWRTGVVVLLAALPFSGLPVFMAGEAGLALRDGAIVLPLYAAFALAMTSRREALLPPVGVALPALVAFAAIVLVHVPIAPSLAVGAIGTKVWLAYIPMLAIGYHFVRGRDDFEGALRLTALLGLAPALIAIAESLLAARQTQSGPWSNDFGPLRYLYGGWFEHVRSTGLALPVGDHTFIVPRVPSTFTSSTQFYLFSMVAYAAGLSCALRTGRWGWAACAAVLAAGAIAAGERQAYIAVPAIAVISSLAAGPRKQHVAWGAGGLALVLAALFVAGGAPLSVLSVLPAHAQASFAGAWDELRGGFGAGLIGNGAGWDTQAALRYGGSASNRYVENWYAKAALELGVAGLAAIVVALASLQWRLFARLRRVDAERRRAAAPVCAVLAAMTATLFKGPVLDLDPLNVYFWLLIGMLLAFLGGHETLGDEVGA